MSKNDKEAPGLLPTPHLRYSLPLIFRILSILVNLESQ